MTFARAPLTLDAAGLARLCATVDTGGYGLVLISSWQAVFRGLVRDENDNAGSVRVVEDVKAAARASKVPWLIDAHSAVRVRTRTTMLTRARRSGAPPARPAPQTSPSRSATPTGLSARSGAWAGNGRFVWFEPVTLDHNLATGTYTALGETKTVASEETWRRLVETGAVTTTPRTAGEIARVAGMVSKDGTPTNTHKRQVRDALRHREGVLKAQEIKHGKQARTYRLACEEGLP